MERVKTGIKGLDQMLQGGLLPRRLASSRARRERARAPWACSSSITASSNTTSPASSSPSKSSPAVLPRRRQLWLGFRELERQGKLKVIMSSPRSRAMTWRALAAPSRRRPKRWVPGASWWTASPTFAACSKTLRIARAAIQLCQRPQARGADQHADAGEPDALRRAPANRRLDRFTVDTYILLRYVEIESVVHKALLVLKFRGSDHAKDIRSSRSPGRGSSSSPGSRAKRVS